LISMRRSALASLLMIALGVASIAAVRRTP